MPTPADSRPPAIALTGIHKAYPNGTVALKDLDLNLGSSEFISLLGPSGCGKSTVLKLIAGLSPPSAGEITWSPDPERHRLAYVFQEAALLPWLTVWENIRLPLKLAQLDRNRTNQRISEAIALVNLGGFERAYPRELSGGMKMRVSIARALVTQPDVLLLDEPFGALDEITRSQLNDELLKLWHRQRWTVVFVTHSIYEAVYLSTQVVVMGTNPGRVIAQVPVSEPQPRSQAFRTAPKYIDVCRRVSDHLHQAITGTPPY
ncbi:MAG: ABC transporter ATP-binding protein [Cyanobacteria bacterium P01_A01_bin.135]